MMPSFTEAGCIPDVAAVAAHLRARTYDRNGNMVGTFTDATTPTADVVDEFIEQAQAPVAGAIGSTPPSSTHALVRQVVSLRAAMDIERSYFPEQIGSGANARSPYEQLRQAYMDDLAALKVAVSEASDDDDTTRGSGNRPRYGFPEDRGGMIGNGSRW